MTKRPLVLAMFLVALVGCNNEKVRTLIDERTQEAVRGVEKAQNPAPPKSYNPLTISNKVWTGELALRLRRGLPLPAKFEGDRGITLVADRALPAREILASVTGQTGIPLRLGDGSDGDIDREIPIAYEGGLSGLLDLLVAHLGGNWRYDGSVITISKFETRVFTVEALPGTQSVKDGVDEDQGSQQGSSGGSGGSSSSSTNSLKQKTEMTAEFKVWDEIQQTVAAMLNGVGTVIIAPSSGTLTVTTTPETMRTVAAFLDEENKRLSRQIAINVEVYKVELSEGTNFNVTLSEVLDRLGGTRMGGSYGSASTMGQTTGSASLSVSIFNKASPDSVLKALSTLGDTVQVSQFPMTTLNNRPVSRRVGRDRSYVASVTSTASTNLVSASSISVTPGLVREGFSLQLTPRLLDDGRIILQYSLNIIDAAEFRTFGGGTTDANGTPIGSNQPAVELPVMATRLFVQQSMLKSGTTLFLSGIDDELVTQSAEGVGHPFNFLLGGGSKNAKTHSMLFIAITPQVLDVPRGEGGGV